MLAKESDVEDIFHNVGGLVDAGREHNSIGCSSCPFFSFTYEFILLQRLCNYIPCVLPRQLRPIVEEFLDFRRPNEKRNGFGR